MENVRSVKVFSAIASTGRGQASGTSTTPATRLGRALMTTTRWLRKTASATLCARASQLQDAGRLRDEHASMAKAYSTMRMRETVGWARELMGGNGILLENHVGRYVADAEAIYSYEGTREVNSLIVGRAVTGESALV